MSSPSQGGRFYPSVIESRSLWHQLDVVIPSLPSASASSLEKLSTKYYYVSSITLIQFLQEIHAGRTIAATVNASQEEDGWHISNDSVLTLRITPESYQRLGPGVVAPKPKKSSDRSKMRKVRIPLGPSGISLQTKASFERWEDFRRQNGRSGWDVFMTCSEEHCQDLPTFCDQYQVQPMMKHYEGVCLPIALTKQPPLASDMDEEDLADIPEWLGMVGIESPRILVNDSVNPYVCKYDRDEGYEVVEVLRVRWRGLLSSQFVRETMDVIQKIQHPLALVTLHGWPEECSEHDKRVSWSWIQGLEKVVMLPASD